MNLDSQRLKELRWDMQITQKQLSTATGIGYSTIQAYEQGTVVPSEQSLRKLAQFLNVSPAYLKGETDDKNPPEHAAQIVEVMAEQNAAVSGISVDQALQIVDKLEKLAKLLNDGAITDQEYKTIKQKIIGQ